jgi:hypothetical protein
MAEDSDFEDPETGGDWFADAGAALAKQRGAREAGKRPRGRPKGSLNRKTRDFDEFYRSQGFEDPLVAMARFVTADPVALQAWFAEHEGTVRTAGKQKVVPVPSLWEIVQERNTVASQLAPYLHGKKPIQLEMIDERLPTLIVDLGTNQLAEGLEIAGRRALSVGAPLGLGGPDGNAKKPNKINDGGDDVA